MTDQPINSDLPTDSQESVFSNVGPSTEVAEFSPLAQVTLLNLESDLNPGLNHLVSKCLAIKDLLGDSEKVPYFYEVTRIVDESPYSESSKEELLRKIRAGLFPDQTEGATQLPLEENEG